MNGPRTDDLDARLARILGRIAPLPPAGGASGEAGDGTPAPRAGTIPAVLQTRFAQITELLERSDAAAAEPLARELRQALPGIAEAARLHGISLLMLDRPDEARAALQDAVRLAPDEYLARCNYAAALMACGDAAAAADILRRVAHEHPDNASVRNNLANALRATGNDAQAREEYLAALALAPGHPGAILNLAAVELSLGMLDSAEQRLRALLARQPHPQGYLLLGNVLNRRADFAGARAAYLQGARLEPAAAEFPYQAGLMADEQHQYAEAAALYRRTLQLNPDLHLAEGQLLFVLRRLYDWDAADRIAARLCTRVAHGDSEIDPFAFLAEDSTPAEQLACARARAERVLHDTQPLRARLRFEPSVRVGDRPLRVGFMSAGFGARRGVPHATALLTAAFFEELGKLEDIELHLIATTPDPGSPIRKRLQESAHAFHEADALSPGGAAQRIHAARIDILVDVDGWCAGAMPDVFALRPAPIQANWLAYPGTSGASFIDYIIADRFVIPEHARRFYSEAVAWLPRCYQPSDTTRLLFDAPPRSSFGLPVDAAVFACFNNSWKMNAASFARSCTILRKVPDSVLWLLSAGREADARLRDAAQGYGIDLHRLVFSPSLPHLQHLARYRHADLFLDTNPYNAHTTASDAIWAGCPVLTRPGQTFASRVAGSLNHYLGVPELIARDDEAFIATATRLGNNRAERTALRARLETQRDTSGLFDMEVYAHDFAELLREMDARRHRGEPPRAIAPPEPVRNGWGKLAQ